MRTKFTIVVADDDLDDQELIKTGLKDCKVKVDVVPVYDGIRLLDYLFRRNQFKHITDTPELLLVDLNMPLMDGFEVIKEIRSHAFLKTVPLYVITTSRSPRDKEKAMQLGATGFYSKGASSKDIVRIMREICQECFESSEEEVAE